MLKKLIALSLAVLLLFCAVSCAQSDSDVPEDMKSATLSGEPFILYVPASWSVNTGSGISGAYVSPNDKIMVSARYYTPSDPSMTVNDYVTLCAEGYKAYEGFAITERIPAVLGGKDAVKLTYTVTDEGKAMTCFQITALHKGDMISLYGYCPTAIWEERAEEFGKIISEFRFCDKTELYTCNADRFRRIVNKVEARSVAAEKIAALARRVIEKKRPAFAYSINRNPLLRLLSLLPKRLQLKIIKIILK